MISSRIFLLTFSALTLTSCGAIPTQYMPNGYRYQDNTPLSSPAPTRPWLDEAANPNLNDIGDNTAAWQGAVYELINPLPATLPPANGPVILQTTPPSTAADQALDHYLRQGLMSYGYTINPTADSEGTVLVYNAAPLSNPEYRKMAIAKFGKEFVKKDDMKGMYYLTLDVKSPDGKRQWLPRLLSAYSRMKNRNICAGPALPTSPYRARRSLNPPYTKPVINFIAAESL